MYNNNKIQKITFLLPKNTKNTFNQSIVTQYVFVEKEQDVYVLNARQHFRKYSL